jgi:hypothetical protein
MLILPEDTTFDIFDSKVSIIRTFTIEVSSVILKA